MHVIFYNGASFAAETVVAGLRDKLGATKITLLDHQPPFEVQGIDVLRMDVHDLMYMKYPTPDWELAPLEQDTVLSMAECEIQCMAMFDKAAKVGRRRVWHGFRVKSGLPMFRELDTSESYDRRRFQYLTHLRFWNDYLDRNKVDAYFIGTIPYAMWDYILYFLCKRRGIPVVTFQHLLIDGYALPITSVEGPDIRLQEAVAAVAAEYAGRENQIALCERSEAFIKRQTDAIRDPHPPYYDMTLNEYKSMGVGESAYIFLKATIKGILLGHQGYTRRRWVEYLAFDYWLRFKKDSELRTLRRFWDKHADFRIEDGPYIYVALAYQPEVSTCPCGGAYTSQELMVDLLAKTVPPGVTVAVKEHPAQKSLSRTIDFYDWMAKQPNVKLVPRDANTYRLIENACAVASVTGSVLMETVFRSIPGLAFGEHNAVYCPGLFRVRSTADVRAAMKQIFEDGVKPTPGGARVFLKALEQLWFRCDNWGRVSEQLMEFSGLTNDQNGEGLATAYAHIYRKVVDGRAREHDEKVEVS